MSAPTDRERQLLAAIVRVQKARHFPATYCELGNLVGLSTTRIAQLVALLEHQGLVTRHRGSARTLLVTTAGLKEAR